MEGKEKMVQIYEVMADMTLDVLNKINSSRKDNIFAVPDEEALEMVRTTQSLYETINHANPVLDTATIFDEFTPTDSSGTKYSALSSSTVRPIANCEYCQ